MKRTLLLVAILGYLVPVQAQKQTDRWYFGNNAGMNFSPGTPYAVQGSLISTEGTTSACDSLGNLIFYSNGVNVWDKNGTIMPNGSGLYGDVSTTTSALAVPYPGNNDLYYLFTLDEANGTHGFCYSLIDMSLNSGNGDVSMKNIAILSNVTEKMSAVAQIGTSNIWVTVHEWGTDAFYSYLVTPSGLQTAPVISNAGMVHTADTLKQNKYGQMKFNTCGTKIAVAVGYTDTVQVLDFDPATGVFYNAVSLPLGAHTYGVEFSQDGSMLYATRYNSAIGFADLLQFDLNAGPPAAVQASMTVISSNTSGINFYYALQLGNDENIYVVTSWSQYLGRIADPSVPGTGCNFDPMGFDLDPNFVGSTAALGLPAFVQSFLKGEIICVAPTGINEVQTETINVHPTISSQGFLLGIEPGSGPWQIRVFDNLGRQAVLYDNITETGYIFGKELAAGSYIVNVTDHKTSQSFRVVSTQ